MIVTVTAYVHSNKESMGDLGEEIGLRGEALQMFLHALNEVTCLIHVDTETGLADIVAVNGKYLKGEQDGTTRYSSRD